MQTMSAARRALDPHALGSDDRDRESGSLERCNVVDAIADDHTRLGPELRYQLFLVSAGLDPRRLEAMFGRYPLQRPERVGGCDHEAKLLSEGL
jgi:hypothetical protein